MGNGHLLSRIIELLSGVLASGASTFRVTAPEIVRPGNTDAYAAKDVIANGVPDLLVFANIGRVAGGKGVIREARVMTDLKTCTARLRLHLFREEPTAIADNSPYLLLWVNADKRVGEITFPAMSTEDPTNSTAAKAHVKLIWEQFDLAEGSTTLYGILETLDAAASAGGQKFTVELVGVHF